MFHACLEQHAPPGTQRDLAALARQLGLTSTHHASIERSACALVEAPHLARFFQPQLFLRAGNEVEILDSDGRTQRLDRVVEFDDAVWVLDYKTGADALLETDATLQQRHGDQLIRYTRLLAELHVDKPICAALLLADGRLIPYPPESRSL